MSVTRIGNVSEYLEEALRGFLECGLRLEKLWAGEECANASRCVVDEDDEAYDGLHHGCAGSFRDAGYTADDVRNAAGAEAQVVDFVLMNWRDVVDLNPADVGQDFWLTRDGHGPGFWDRGRERGDRLTAAAKMYGDCGLYAVGLAVHYRG